MFAVIKTGGKQYRVQAGDMLVVEKLDGEAGAAVAFNEVLMIGEGADVVVGAPLVEGAVVNATLIETRKGEKVKIFKKIRRQGYRRTRGHRQFESVLRVTSVAAGKNESKWDGVIDLTTKAVLDARARNLKSVAEAASAPVAAPKAAKTAAPKKAKAEAAPAIEAEAPAKKAAAPKKADAPKAETKSEAKAEAAPKKAAPKAKAKSAE
jgi:large subunit ribosomal protein L21